jgi:predicted dehydrogenase
MLRAGIIGCGRIVEEGHAEVFLKLKDEVEVVAITGHQSLQRLQVVGEKLGISKTRWYMNYQDMLERESLDFVDIAVPHFLHRTIAVDCARAGVGILLEKPMATTLREADDILQAVQENRVKFCIMHNYKYQEANVLAIKWIKEDRIGQPFLIRSELSTCGHWRGATGSDPDWRTRLAKSGGGALMDNGYHSIYLVEELMSSPIKNVYVRLGTYVQCTETEDTAVLLATHKNGGISDIQVSWGIRMDRSKTEIHGPKGSILMNSDARVSVVSEDSREYSQEVSPSWGFEALFREFAKSLRNDTDPPVTGEEGRRILGVVLAGYESAREGSPVEV